MGTSFMLVEGPIIAAFIVDLEVQYLVPLSLDGSNVDQFWHSCTLLMPDV